MIDVNELHALRGCRLARALCIQLVIPSGESYSDVDCDQEQEQEQESILYSGGTMLIAKTPAESASLQQPTKPS